jgi:hypothetical protein
MMQTSMATKMAEIIVDFGYGLTVVALANGTLPKEHSLGSAVTIAFHPSAVLIGIVD